MTRRALCLAMAIASLAAAGDARADRIDPKSVACRPVTTGKVKIALRAGFTAREAAVLYHGLTCHPVTMSAVAADVSSRKPFRRTVDAAGLDRAMAAMAKQLGLVVLRDRDDLLLLEVDADGFAVMPSYNERVKIAATEPSSDPELDKHIHAVSETEYEIDRVLVDRMAAEQSEMFKGMRIVPSLKDNVVIGFKLFSIRPASLAARLGLRNGDTVHRLNGRELSGVENALKAYESMAGADRAEIELSRKGKRLKLVWKLAD